MNTDAMMRVISRNLPRNTNSPEMHGLYGLLICHQQSEPPSRYIQRQEKERLARAVKLPVPSCTPVRLCPPLQAMRCPQLLHVRCSRCLSGRGAQLP
jgi:hypothetical protein